LFNDYLHILFIIVIDFVCLDCYLNERGLHWGLEHTRLKRVERVSLEIEECPLSLPIE